LKLASLYVLFLPTDKTKLIRFGATTTFFYPRARSRVLKGFTFYFVVLVVVLVVLVVRIDVSQIKAFSEFNPS
jgi:hypothetical protein